MKKLFVSILLLCIFISTEVYAKENFFDEAKNKYDEKKLEDSKFLFQRNIVFNPKDAKSYLYLAKIYNSEENERKEIKYLKTTLLLEPDNEEAMYMLIDIELKKSNFSEVKKLTKNFIIICSSFCDKTKSINERLKNIEAKDESKQ
jgi:tetratricopeptide (TPR) repeat protein|tara:strand:- start:27 stop:464 length:438 start_codon:yes stop_codon:yes gene_type:complete